MRLSQEEWNKRLDELKLASEDCKSIREMAEITDLNVNNINAVLRKFPKDAEAIKKNLDSNKPLKKVTKRKSNKPDISKRIEQILLASETCNSMSAISKLTGLSSFIIKSTLNKFPTEAEKVKENLAKNKTGNEISCKAEKTKTVSKNDDELSIVMLDTSINHFNNIFSILEEYVQSGKTLGITDIVLEELAALQKSNYRKDACSFLHIIMDNISAFKLFEVKHSMLEKETVDEAIIRTTLNWKDKTLLLTSDKEMYIKATLKGANVKYLPLDNEERPKAIFNVNKVSELKVTNKKYVVSFVDIIVENMQAFYVEKNRTNQITKIFSRKGEEKQGNRIELEVGDHIFICTAKEDYMTFADYEIYDTTVNTVNMRFNSRIYNCDPIINFAQSDYKKFAEHARRILDKE